ncbi:MAG: tetratricopeptide repeat protein [Candidatus Omnitrophota bacterium]
MQKNIPVKIKTTLKTKITLIITGIFLFLALLEAGLRAGGAILTFAQEYGNWRSIKEKGVYRILCLGESTTAKQYPQHLEKILNQRHEGVRFSVIDKGKPATVTTVIVSQVESYLDEYHPDLVIAMMGVNDPGQYISIDAASPAKTGHFVKSLKIYKLTRLLWLHFQAKTKEVRLYNRNEYIGRFARAQDYILEAQPQNVSAEVVLSENAFKKALELNPQDDNAYAELGAVYQIHKKYPESEMSFRKALEINPRNDEAHTGLGFIYQLHGKLLESEMSFKKALEINPENSKAYLGLGLIYEFFAQYPESERSFRKALEINPQNDKAYTGLGIIYQIQGKFLESERSFKKALEINPQNDKVYTGLGIIYQIQGKFLESKGSFEKALEINPRNDSAYAGLGAIYYVQGKLPESEEALNKALEVNPNNGNVYARLGWCYCKQGKFLQAIDLFKKAAELDPKSDRAIGAVSVLYDVVGNQELAGEYDEKLNRLRLKYYRPITVNNYHKLKKILDNRGVRLVCSQYPMRNIAPLKKIFEEDEGVVFVDNEAVFKEAVRISGFNALFVDMFAGDFGHCTRKGNQLLAENIANAILKEVIKDL